MDNDQSSGEETSPHGADWEVVQLTASAYAAAPGPKEAASSKEGEDSVYVVKGHGSSTPLLLSGHFSASETEVESFLKGTDSKEFQKEVGGQDLILDERAVDEIGEKYGETDKSKLTDDLHGIESFDKGKSLSLVDMEFEGRKTLQGMDLVGEESSIFSSSGYNSLQTEMEFSRLISESKNDAKLVDPSLQALSSLMDSAKVAAINKENKNEGSVPPPEAWWKRQLVSLYKSAKESNKFWPIVVAAAAATAALMGIAYFGRRWQQRGRLQLCQVKLQSAGNNERNNNVVGPLNRIKDLLVASNQQSLLIHANAPFR